MLSKSSPWVRYGYAVISVVAALVINRLLWKINPAISPVFCTAVMVSAWLGGLGPGLLATALAAFASAYFFSEPLRSLDLGADDLIQLIAFTAEAILISSLQEASHRASTRLQQAKEAAEGANQAKDRFMSVLSHELRMPLNPVLAASSAYSNDASLSAELRGDMQMIRRNVELEARLIDDLLDLSRLNKGKLHLHDEVLDTHLLLGEAYRTSETEICKKNLQVIWDLQARQHFIRGDGARIQQIFWNLIRNAVKFTPPGGSVFIRSGDERDGRLRIQVQDTGVGIERDSLGRIFDAFEQGHSGISHRFGGLGLGLAISKALVSLHGGEISGDSAGLGQGATFKVVFPTTTAPVASLSDSAPLRSADSIHRALRILLVEDHEDTRRLMSRLLEAAHHSVTTASSIGSAMSAAESASFDIVVSDLGLPDGSGLELMRQLRQQYHLKGIALSGYGAEADIRKSNEAGFAQHLTKPIDFQSLESALQHVAGGRIEAE